MIQQIVKFKSHEHMKLLQFSFLKVQPTFTDI
jgi:hypothetical protein